MSNKKMQPKIAVLLPCYNEQQTLATVINDFRKELPEADIFVYDNNSVDNSVVIATENKAIVRYEARQGKGYVVRSMFMDVDADIFVMADSDDTYPAKTVHKMIQALIEQNADMVTGDRLSEGQYAAKNKRNFHHFGNNLVRWLINKLFKANLSDIMTGYRVFNQRFVANMPVMSSGFEIETEMTLHALDKRFKIVEVAIDYQNRPYGSTSKLNTFADGFKILKTILWLFKDYKPLTFFSLLSLILFIFSVMLAIPVFIEFSTTGLVAKIPTTILSLGIMILSVLSLFVGFILDTVVRQHKINYELNLKSHK